MAELVISCLSQKGGVGKSTLARLIARTYAEVGWSVKICDFNSRQKTSVDWVAIRQANNLNPEIAAEPYSSVKSMKREVYDLLVVDGRPDSDSTSLEAARIADLNVIPSGHSADDLRPQVLFANELVTKGVDRGKILFVLCKTTGSKAKSRQAREFITGAGYKVTPTDLPYMTSYENAQDVGAALSETGIPTLDERADSVAAEIVDRMNELQGETA